MDVETIKKSVVDLMPEQGKTEIFTHPRISIIVVAYNNENFIEQALHSCIYPGYDDYEVIVVYNASSDDTLKMIKRVAEQCPDRFNIIENTTNVGLGEARNIGMAAAKGEYILFLDGDDWFAPNIYPRLRSLIAEKDFEICFFRHQRFWEDGKKTQCAYKELFLEGYRTGSERDRMFFSLFNVAWNKLYKRSLLEKHQILFERGLYEDITWTYSLMLHTEKLYVISDELYFYRQRPGSICRSRSLGHIDAITRFRKIFQIFVNDPHQKEWGNDLYLWARSQFFYIMLNNRLPIGEEKQFMIEADRLLADYRKAIGRNKPTLRERVLRTHNIRFYLLMDKLFSGYAAQKRALLRRFPWLRSWGEFRLHVFIFLYKHILVKYSPLVENRVLFECLWGQKVDCNPRALSQKLSESGDFECIWSLKSPQDSEIDHRFTPVKRHGWAFWKAAATSKYLVTNVNFSDYIIKREGQIMIGTQHGTPIKLMALDVRETRPKEMNWAKFAQRTSRYDYVLSSNRHSSRVWRQSHPYAYKLLESGYPRNDVLFRDDPTLVASIRKKLGIPVGAKIALYAPTYRDDEVKNKNCSEYKGFDPVAVKQALGNEFVLLMRSHHLVPSEMPAENAAGIIDAKSFEHTNDLLLCADLLITDYSSIMFDYACLKRPIVLYCPDYDEYVAGRGVYFDIRQKSPGPVASTMEELSHCLRERSYNSEENRERLLHFNKEFCEFDDGHAAERVIARVFKPVH